MTTRTAASYVNDSVRFTDGIEEAVRQYAGQRPWQGTREERFDKLAEFHAKLCEVCEVTCQFEVFGIETYAAMCGYFQHDTTMRVAGRLSVVNYLYHFAAVIYPEVTEDMRMTFCVNLYKRGFPRSFSRADLTGRYVVAR